MSEEGHLVHDAVSDDMVHDPATGDLIYNPMPTVCPWGLGSSPDPLYISVANQPQLTDNSPLGIATVLTNDIMQLDADGDSTCVWDETAPAFGWNSTDMWEVLGHIITIDGPSPYRWKMTLGFKGKFGTGRIGLWQRIAATPVGLYTWVSGEVGAVGEDVIVTS